MDKKLFTKRSNGRSGMMEITIPKITDKVIEKYEKLSRDDLLKVDFIVSEIPNFDELVVKSIVWQHFISEVDKLEISWNLREKCSYKGGEFSIVRYLFLRGNQEGSMNMITLADIGDVLIAIAYAKAQKNFEQEDELKELLCFHYMLYGFSGLEDTSMAGHSRTSEGTRENQNKGKVRKEKAIDLAIQLRSQNSDLFKVQINKMIALELGVKPKTVGKYLAGIDIG